MSKESIDLTLDETKEILKILDKKNPTKKVAGLVKKFEDLLEQFSDDEDVYGLNEHSLNEETRQCFYEKFGF